MSAPAFIHRFEAGTNAEATPLLLLHGTGGDENDLIPLGRAVAPGAALLSPRGKVLEHGSPRFFRRLAEGVFDENDVRRRAIELAAFVEDVSTRLSGEIGRRSGGERHHRPQQDRARQHLRAQQQHRGRDVGAVRMAERDGRTDTVAVLIMSGARDPIAPPEHAARLADILREVHARIEHRILPERHGFSKTDITASRGWLEDVAKAQLVAAA